MNIYSKIALMACGVAIASSAITVVAVDKLENKYSISPSSYSSEAPSSGGSFYTVAHGVTPPTDFTHAAESTINGVVSIKSFASPRGYNGYGSRQQQQTPFSDPLFDFFFGSPSGRGSRPQQQQPSEKAEQQIGPVSYTHLT